MITIITSIIALIIGFKEWNECRTIPRAYIGIGIGIMSMISLGTTMIDNFVGSMVEPSAMDVYNGKTTLQKTYIDGEAVDSIVIFKRNDR